ncbi:cysteine/O-acetylserine transporter [Rouxiella sp. Mn2063]|uniref:cysteine/O-acetylserine transporter n=1 Tax=Rouxiella sp. Mn2063 TaxID=3395262 RepID=UPI003BDCBCC2
MTPAIISAFFTYTFITAMTPGPNNILALSSVSSHGLSGSRRVLTGMSLGFLAVMLLCAAITFTLTRLDPGIAVWLNWIGAAYILWLAVKVAMSRPSSSGSSTQPLSFWASFGLQFVNVKIILYGITAISSFVLPYTHDMLWVIAVSLLLSLIGTIGILSWALAGHVFQALFQRHGRIVNLTLAALLVYCAIRMFV